MNSKAVLLILILGLIASCNCKLEVPAEYVMTKPALKDSIWHGNKTLVLFWTDWCEGSKQMIEQYYLPLNDTIKSKGLDISIVLLGADENITLADIKYYRSMGLATYYIENPGGNAISNRMAIKDFINGAFPGNKFEHINEFQFGIPVQMLVNKKLEIVNDTNYDKSFDLICEVLDLTWEKVE